MIHFKKHSGIYTLSTEQILNVPLKQAWKFFSAPGNLQKITPSHMGFQITSEVDKKAYAGQIITYKVGILPGIKSSWVTEITQVKEQQFFIDEQRFGPYSMWHHEHWFEGLSEGKTLMKDKISYKIPFGFLGHIAQSIFIKRQLKGIFKHRYSTLEKLFNGR
ncbi:SRPBCC family protein [Tenacibaculum sp. 1B UA]|uniref:SRPBCC family protein n=1 Tax=unclassified Tenacibaculum TaxID=2635139 RepID=UPI0026E15688|nr:MULTISPECIES: SRPBCC family protein [unclassified Tenacibaculum]MDO6675340.1 SRPBCC family protein [Tenacibaculum sp. 1_MG-2023]MDX8553859.1 SRPBCC family protein [Tenacibaculum sp. 1B UA]